MLNVWYDRPTINCSTISDDGFSNEEYMCNYKERYRTMKRKLKLLVYENECFQEALRSAQRKLLKANRDKCFLMDRLLYYEKVEGSYSENDEETDTSNDEMFDTDCCKRKKTSTFSNIESNLETSAATKSHHSFKKKKSIPKTFKVAETLTLDASNMLHYSLVSDGHMTPEEVEKHLESRQNYLELVPEKAPPTVPTEMFSNDTSLDKLE